MSEIRKDKIHEACDAISKLFDEMGLSYKECEIVCEAGYKTAKAFQLDEKTREEIEEALRKPTLEEKVMKVLPSIIVSALDCWHSSIIEDGERDSKDTERR